MKKLLAIIGAIITGGLTFIVANSVQIALAGRELN
jgi:hypothetical protein